MTRIDIEQADVLDAIAAKLQSGLDLNERQCYPVARAEDVPSIPTGGDYWLTVAPGPGRFEPEEQMPKVAGTGAGAAVAGNVTEDTTATVTIYTRIKTDSTGHDRNLLMDEYRGLLAIKKKVLAALVGQDLVDDDGNPFLRQLLFAQTCTGPDLASIGKGDIPFGRLAITFGVIFDWDLTG